MIAFIALPVLPKATAPLQQKSSTHHTQSAFALAAFVVPGLRAVGSFPVNSFSGWHRLPLESQTQGFLQAETGSDQPDTPGTPAAPGLSYRWL